MPIRNDTVLLFYLDLIYLTCLTSSVFLVNELRKLISRILLKRYHNRQNSAINQWMV